MLGMFDNTPADPQAVERVKQYFARRFNLPADTLISVAELRCRERDCPPVETVVTARGADGATRDWRIHKSIGDITRENVEALN